MYFNQIISKQKVYKNCTLEEKKILTTAQKYWYDVFCYIKVVYILPLTSYTVLHWTYFYFLSNYIYSLKLCSFKINLFIKLSYFKWKVIIKKNNSFFIYNCFAKAKPFTRMHTQYRLKICGFAILYINTIFVLIF